jgi:hypothetical protein
MEAAKAAFGHLRKASERLLLGRFQTVRFYSKKKGVAKATRIKAIPPQGQKAPIRVNL